MYSPFGNPHGNNYFKQETSLDTKTIGQTRLRNRCFAVSECIPTRYFVIAIAKQELHRHHLNQVKSMWASCEDARGEQATPLWHACQECTI